MNTQKSSVTNHLYLLFSVFLRLITFLYVYGWKLYKTVLLHSSSQCLIQGCHINSLKCPWWEYLYHGNSQALQMRVLFSGDIPQHTPKIRK